MSRRETAVLFAGVAIVIVAAGITMFAPYSAGWVITSFGLVVIGSLLIIGVGQRTK